MSSGEPARQPAQGITGPIDVLLDECKGDAAAVFQCRVCNTRIPGSANAREHDCREPTSCPFCDHSTIRVTRGVDGRVDVCSCGLVLDRPSGGDAG